MELSCDLLRSPKRKFDLGGDNLVQDFDTPRYTRSYLIFEINGRADVQQFLPVPRAPARRIAFPVAPRRSKSGPGDDCRAGPYLGQCSEGRGLGDDKEKPTCKPMDRPSGAAESRTA